MTKRKDSKSIIIILSFIIFIILGFIFALPLIKNTSIYKNYQVNKLVTFTSAKAKFSLSHISSRPIIEASPSNGNEIIGSYYFNNEEFNEAGNGVGYILVSKKNGINSLDQYIDSINHEKKEFIKGGEITIPIPKIVQSSVGGEKAIWVEDKKRVALYGFPWQLDQYYIVVRKGLIYRFQLYESARLLEDQGRFISFQEMKPINLSEKNLEDFKKLISTVKFID